jgi:hypothetical protein
VPIKFLIDEQINTRVASALRAKGVEAISVHELGLGNQGYKDEPLLELATSREETLLTLDSDFPVIHSQWQATNKSHFGIFYGETPRFQHSGAIGIIVRFCVFWSELIGDDDEALKETVYNEIQFIQEP